jgi:lincosamide nucleotidyltransferase A/C/D/E
VRSRDVVEILERLEAAGVRHWVDGGWGVDALLGEETRSHSDLDLVVARADAGTAQAALAPLGFAHAPDVTPGLPPRLVLRDERGRQVDLHLVVFDAAGSGWQQLGPGAWGLYPAEGLKGEGSIAGRRVACLGPELQLRHHLGYAWDSDDRHDMELLARRFGVRLPPA